MTRAIRATFSILTGVLVASMALPMPVASAEVAPEPISYPEKKPIPTRQKALNFGLVFVAQVGVYYIDQSAIIEDHGSFKEWWRHQTSPHFDKDSFDYNLVKHSLVGQYYYLFYRSRGYEERQAFFWTFLSSLAFEFGIEAYTEKPSFQDMYQTPVFGTIVGIGAEKLSNYFHSIETIPTTILAYIFNPMTLIPGSKCDCGVIPVVNGKGEAAVYATVRF